MVFQSDNENIPHATIYRSGFRLKIPNPCARVIEMRESPFISSVVFPPTQSSQESINAEPQRSPLQSVQDAFHAGWEVQAPLSKP